MERPTILKWLLTGFGVADPPISKAPAQEDDNRRVQEYQKIAREHFQLELIDVPGREALAKWQELKSAGRGSPVVLGGKEMDRWGNPMSMFDPANLDDRPLTPVRDIVRRAAGISFPRDLAKLRADEAIEAGLDHLPPVGEWPTERLPSTGLHVDRDTLTGEPFPRVYIALAPTDDWTTIPAYLRWGGWNECPAAEHHIAALRTWRDRYGAELVGMSHDIITLRVAERPKTREEALALARDQYVYCADIIDQGTQTYNRLAATLMADDWWFFWWD